MPATPRLIPRGFLEHHCPLCLGLGIASGRRMWYFVFASMDALCAEHLRGIWDAGMRTQGPCVMPRVLDTTQGTYLALDGHHPGFLPHEQLRDWSPYSRCTYPIHDTDRLLPDRNRLRKQITGPIVLVPKVC